MEQIQTDEDDRPRWIFYSALDAKATHELYHALKVGARHGPPSTDCAVQAQNHVPRLRNMRRIRCCAVCPFGLRHLKYHLITYVKQLIEELMYHLITQVKRHFKELEAQLNTKRCCQNWPGFQQILQ